MRFKLLVAILVLALATHSVLSQEDETKVVSDTEESPPSDSGGILNFLLTPFKATISRARKLFGLSSTARDNVREILRDGFDEIQVRAFKLFMSVYNKTYESPAEIRKRMGLFMERRKKIQQSVRDFAEGRVPFIMRENAFTDWDDEELKALAKSSPPKTQAEMTEDEREIMKKIKDQAGDDEKSGDQPETTTTAAPSNASSSSGEESLAVSRHVREVDYDEDFMDIDWNDTDYMDLDNDNMAVMAPERIPASKDWRESGCVARPIDQQKCGACYAIATMNTLETMRCINKVSSPILSPQQIVDCSTPRAGYQNHGCDGGWPTRVLKYLQDVRVVTRDSCYPFVRRQNTCQLRKVQATEGCTMTSSPTGTSLQYKVLDNEQDILYHVAKTGPVITVMQTLDSFVFYSKGIYDDPKCTRRRNDVDHAISIVGYGRENGMDYWLIKNSWGTEDWGEGGYAKFRRGKRACSIGSWGWVITK